MENNVFYVYIRLRGASWAALPPAVRSTVSSNYGDVMIVDLCVCKESEVEKALVEKAHFWKESMAGSQADYTDAELVMHQIQVANGGFELSPATIGCIAQADLSLHMARTTCQLK